MHGSVLLTQWEKEAGNYFSPVEAAEGKNRSNKSPVLVSPKSLSLEARVSFITSL